MQKLSQTFITAFTEMAILLEIVKAARQDSLYAVKRKCKIMSRSDSAC